MEDLASDCFIGNIETGIEIGRGENGRVYEGKWEGTVVAVKEIHSMLLDDLSKLEIQSLRRCFLQEYQILYQLRHPNIVQFLGIGISYHSPGVMPSLIMERLHCNLTSLLKHNPLLPINTMLLIISDVVLGLRYLHTHTPPIIHGNLSSNKILISKAMEGRIGDPVTARLVAARSQSQITKPATEDFMSPEAFSDVAIGQYGTEADVFAFGCIMLHALSHQWPTPSLPVITDPMTNNLIARSEIERRSSYFAKVDKTWSSTLTPLIEGCLGNIPRSRISIIEMCDRLDELVDKKNSLIKNVLTHQKIQTQDSGIKLLITEEVKLQLL